MRPLPFLNAICAAAALLLAACIPAAADDLIFVVPSGAAAGPWSYLRFFNSGAAPGHVTVSLADTATGAAVTTWTSPAIASHAAAQYAINAIEGAAAQLSPPPQSYLVTIHSDFAGSAAQVFWRPQQAMVDVTTCPADGDHVLVGNLATDVVPFVHSSLIDNGYQSVVVVVNTTDAAFSGRFLIYHAATGELLGTAPIDVAAGAGRRVLVQDLESAAGIRPQENPTFLGQYVVALDRPFAGYLQHLIMNITENGSVMADMTPACALTAP